MAEVVDTPTTITPKNEYVEVKKPDFAAIAEEGLTNMKKQYGVVDDATPANAKVETPVEAPATTEAPTTQESPITTETPASPGDLNEIEQQLNKALTEMEATIGDGAPMPTPSTPTTPSAKESQAQIDSSIQDKIKEYESILNDPLLKSVVELRKAGKNIFSAINEISGSDPDKMTATDLITEDCKRLGITDEDLIQSELDAFSNKTPREQAQEVNRIKGILSQERDANLAKYSQEVSKQSFDIQAEANKNINKLGQELEAIYSEKADKDYYGIKTTPEILSAVKGELHKGLGLFNEDGSMNAQEHFRLAYLKTQIGLIMRKVGTDMFHKGKGDVYNEVARVSKNEVTAKPPVITDTNKSPSEIGEEVIKSLMGKGFKS